MRKKILQIHERTDLSPSDKNQKVQLLMSSPQLSSSSSQISSNIVCAHYQRNCVLYCDTCSNFYPCHICHDENEDHPFNRFNTAASLLKCSICNTIQSIQKACSSCKTSFGAYFCEKCLVIENDEAKKIFHCDDCGICRVGNRSHFFHCLICGCCLSNAFNNETNQLKGHKCIERSLDSNCPICGEYLFSSRTGVIFMVSCYFICNMNFRFLVN